MVAFYVSLCDIPFPCVSLRGWLDFSRKAMHFHRSWWQFPQIDIVINYRDIVEVNPCSHLLIFPAVEIRLVCGTVYKFMSMFERRSIIEALKHLM